MPELTVYVIEIIKRRNNPHNWYDNYIGKKFLAIIQVFNNKTKYRIVNDRNFNIHLVDIDDAIILKGD